MKKLKLKALSLGAREILSREQLRSINGGCTTATDCGVGQLCDQNNQCENDPNGPSGGSGSGGSIHLCPDLEGGLCGLPNKHWFYPQAWNNSTQQCENDPYYQPVCI
jgi:hypothetical protein